MHLQWGQTFAPKDTLFLSNGPHDKPEAPAPPLGVPRTGSAHARWQAEPTPFRSRNPMGRTGLRGRGSLSYFGPNHTLQPVVTR